jgi:transposase-like protein
MTTKNKIYTNQFKIDAVKLVTDQGYEAAETAWNLGIHPNVLRH